VAPALVNTSTIDRCPDPASPCRAATFRLVKSHRAGGSGNALVGSPVGAPACGGAAVGGGVTAPTSNVGGVTPVPVVAPVLVPPQAANRHAIDPASIAPAIWRARWRLQPSNLNQATLSRAIIMDTLRYKTGTRLA
jgi:hypothetical protein